MIIQKNTEQQLALLRVSLEGRIRFSENVGPCTLPDGHPLGVLDVVISRWNVVVIGFYKLAF